MSDLTRIAKLLQQTIADRQQLAIGESVVAIIPGSAGLFTIGNKTISAIATNYCYGNCLLAKVEGKWYAVNPDDNQRVIRSSVDILTKRNYRNASEELPTVLIEFAPGSSTELEPNAGDFVVRIKINRPQSKDLRVRCELVGTATNGDYTVVGLDNDQVAIIPAGELFFDFILTPTQNSAGQNESIEINLLQSRDYRIGQDNTVTAMILGAITATVSIAFAPGSPTQLIPGTGNFIARISLNAPLPFDLSIACDFGGTTPLSDYTFTGLDSNLFALIPSGLTYTDIVITPIQNPSGFEQYIYPQILPSIDYSIGQSQIEVVIDVPTQVGLQFASGNSVESVYSGAGNIVFRVFLFDALTQDLPVSVVLSGTVPSVGYTVTGLNGSGQAVIVAGDLFADITVTPTGAAGTITLSVSPTASYSIVGLTNITANVLRRSYTISRSVGIATNGVVASFGASTRIGGRAQDNSPSKQIACRFRAINSSGNPVPIQGQDLTVTYILSGCTPNIDYVLPPGAVASPLPVTGTINIPVGSSSATLLISPIISPTTGGVLEFDVVVASNSFYVSTGANPTAQIQKPAVATIGTVAQYTNRFATSTITGGSLYVPGFSGNSSGIIGGFPSYFEIVFNHNPAIFNPTINRHWTYQFSGTAVLGVDYAVNSISNILGGTAGLLGITSKNTVVGSPTKTIIISITPDDGYDIGTPSSTQLLVI